MFQGDIKELARANASFRRVIYTGTHSQLVVMSIPAGGDIGDEIHEATDQILFFIEGNGEAVLNGETRRVEPHQVVCVTAGTQHNFRNTGAEDLKLFTVYSPPAHKDGTVHATKKDAEAEEHY
jgi:mannose-6-phosphate isomerase-like protein (cupin superfamily)